MQVQENYYGLTGFILPPHFSFIKTLLRWPTLLPTQMRAILYAYKFDIAFMIFLHQDMFVVNSNTALEF